MDALTLGERYVAREQLSGNALASVWAGEDLVLDRPVAIKVLARRLQEDPRAAAIFEHEALAASALSDHPHAMTILRVGQHQKGPAIMMEFLAGRTVRTALAETPRPARTVALNWISQAASAIDAAHDRGLLHRDVRPGNLMLDDDDARVVVADFGIARVIYESAQLAMKAALGTAAYLAPEQVLDEPATPATDRYALAVVAYELLTGGLPHEARPSFEAVARARLDADPVPVTTRDPALPAEVDEILRRGLDRDPARRWPDAGAFVAALAAALGHPQAA